MSRECLQRKVQDQGGDLEEIKIFLVTTKTVQISSAVKVGEKTWPWLTFNIDNQTIRETTENKTSPFLSPF